MMQHELKTDQSVFILSWTGVKPFEIRLNDRDFRSGDILILKETRYSDEEMKSGKPLEYTGRQLTRRVDFIVSGYGLQDGWVVMTVAVM